MQKCLWLLVALVVTAIAGEARAQCSDGCCRVMRVPSPAAELVNYPCDCGNDCPCMAGGRCQHFDRCPWTTGRYPGSHMLAAPSWSECSGCSVAPAGRRRLFRGLIFRRRR